jgi:hypothetical protein
MESDEKKCPRCAETVKAEAKVCRHCGYDFATGAAPGAAAAPPKKRGAGSKVLGCVGLAIVILIILAVIGSNMDPASKTSGGEAAVSAEPAVKVTAQELASAYEANEAAAQQRFGDRPLEVTATVTAVQLDFSNEPFLVLAGTNQFMGPQAKLTEASRSKASGVSKGQSIVLRCASVSEVVGTPMLSDCDF